jgi:hypothetical protein
MVWFFKANETTTDISKSVEILRTAMQAACEASSDLPYRRTAVNDGKAIFLS